MGRCGSRVWERLGGISWDTRQEGGLNYLILSEDIEMLKTGEHEYGRILWQVRLKRLTPHAVIVRATEFAV